MFLKVSQFFFYHILVAQSLESKTFICHEEKGLSIINIGFIYMWVLYENRSFCSCASSPLMYIHDAALLDTMWCCFCLNQIHDTNQSWVLMIGRIQFWKTSWEQEKMLVSCIFSAFLVMFCYSFLGKFDHNEQNLFCQESCL